MAPACGHVPTSAAAVTNRVTNASRSLRHGLTLEYEDARQEAVMVGAGTRLPGAAYSPAEVPARFLVGRRSGFAIAG